MIEDIPETASTPPQAGLIGTWRRFGTLSAAYEIISDGRPLLDGDCLMRVRVAETEEVVDYR